jgi:hypothetical protein
MLIGEHMQRRGAALLQAVCVLFYTPAMQLYALLSFNSTISL